jgi:hypothetical protein
MLLEEGTVTGFEAVGDYNKDSKFTYDTVEQTATITDPTIISNSLIQF